MIKAALIGSAVIAGVSFAAGVYVGWKTTMHVVAKVKKEKVK